MLRAWEMRVSPATKLVFKLALHHASRAGRQTIEGADLFAAVFEEFHESAGNFASQTAGTATRTVVGAKFGVK